MSGRLKRTTRYQGRYDEQNDGLTELGKKQLRYLGTDNARRNTGVGIGKTLIPKCSGEGLFATRKFKLNEFICFYDGVKVSEEQLKKMDDSNEYLWSDDSTDNFICINTETRIVGMADMLMIVLRPNISKALIIWQIMPR